MEEQSLEENKPFVSGRVSAAAAVAGSCSQDVLDGLGGFDAHLPERGRSLSGGQRQRLALARSLRADPDVLVLSEPTSAVDAHTEAAIASALSGLREGRTTVVTTTRTSIPGWTRPAGSTT